MVTIPFATPVTTPVTGFTVATDKSLLDHEPPAVVSVSVIVVPAHTPKGPAIGPIVPKAVIEKSNASNERIGALIDMFFLVKTGIKI